ncbi:hypothetical protein WS50_28170 [Burkholderia territorii]|uniref:hypothetical protein n=1 Tax=Burkholderia territorii TaxID=1503055 RepID=UPI000759BF65|nr:hypothetical protein [Burkholderia territorii]KUZ02445.1 hypothetical protein WS47_02470 [Burkholderia territorii]KUZ06169.1 hypothetical protein WS50_28170 [Burkholderia territorii]
MSTLTTRGRVSIHSDADQTAPPSLTGAATARRVPHAPTSVHDGGPHALYPTRRQRVDDALLAFERA